MIKEALFNHCKASLKKRMNVLEHQKKSLQSDLTLETKSSAGDKYETGRAMIQLEREKLGNQIKEIELKYQKLNSVKEHKISISVRLGSVVFTDNANYYISIATDFCEIDSKLYYCISTQSPIGKLLIGKKTNDCIQYNGVKSEILEIL